MDNLDTIVLFDKATNKRVYALKEWAKDMLKLRLRSGEPRYRRVA